MHGFTKNFPSQVVSDVEKISYEYGLKVAKAIEQEWFGVESNTNRWGSNLSTFQFKNIKMNYLSMVIYLI